MAYCFEIDFLLYPSSVELGIYISIISIFAIGIFEYVKILIFQLFLSVYAHAHTCMLSALILIFDRKLSQSTFYNFCSVIKFVFIIKFLFNF